MILWQFLAKVYKVEKYLQNGYDPIVKVQGERDCIIFPGIVIAIGGNQNDFPTTVPTS